MNAVSRNARPQPFRGRRQAGATLVALAIVAPLTACFKPTAEGETSDTEATATTTGGSPTSSTTTGETPTSSGGGPSTTADETSGTTDATTTTTGTTSTTGPALDEPQCGDGLVDPDLNEECDDGNVFNDDECTNFCKLPICGDGFVSAGEACDDGNGDSEDGCTNTCQCERNSCGDGVKDPDEECDDGNRSDRDACSACCERRFFNVFVSSKKFVGGALIGPQGGDAACTELAAAAKLPGTYQAWLAGDRGVASPLALVFSQPYALAGTGEIVANSLKELRSGQLVTAIHVTETGKDLGAIPEDPCTDPELRVWTGTDFEGTGVFDGSCSSWTVTIGAGRFGAAGTAGPHWASCAAEAKCATMARLYCFEVQT
jgi:cysteine-rich repeat protein